MFDVETLKHMIAARVSTNKAFQKIMSQVYNVEPVRVKEKDEGRFTIRKKGYAPLNYPIGYKIDGKLITFSDIKGGLN